MPLGSSSAAPVMRPGPSLCIIGVGGAVAGSASMVSGAMAALGRRRGARVYEASLNRGTSVLELAMLADVPGWRAGQGRLRNREELDDLAHVGLPVLALVDVDPQQRELRVVGAVGEPRAGHRVPQLAHLRAVLEDLAGAAQRHVEIVGEVDVVEHHARVAAELLRD